MGQEQPIVCRWQQKRKTHLSFPGWLSARLLSWQLAWCHQSTGEREHRGSADLMSKNPISSSLRSLQGRPTVPGEQRQHQKVLRELEPPLHQFCRCGPRGRDRHQRQLGACLCMKKPLFSPRPTLQQQKRKSREAGGRWEASQEAGTGSSPHGEWDVGGVVDGGCKVDRLHSL